MKTSSFCVSDGKGFNLSATKCNNTLQYTESDRPKVEEEMRSKIVEIAALQDKLYAQNTHAVLLIIQAMDAAGKDGTIKHVTSGLNPQGCQVVSFKAPSANELDHDYLWRIAKEVPQRGNIGIFNRSHYEEVLVAKVHDLPKKQPLPQSCLKGDIWDKRYRQINNFERYLFENGIVPIKIFLHVSKSEQKARILDRIDDPSKNWKFSAADLAERELWPEYQSAFEDMIQNTSTEHAPWYVVPADNKWFARALVTEILLDTLRKIDPQYPDLPEDQKKILAHYRDVLENEKPAKK
jgi:PPK2 family polyphosphate:nucleotide phosphotransferase